jgi:hypothetical protein
VVNGAFQVGIPVLAYHRLDGATAYGAIESAIGGGAVAGVVLAGVLPRAKRPAPQLMGVAACIGVFLIALGFVSSTAVAVTLGLCMGVVTGYVNILFFTWFQMRTPPDMMGRMMGLLLFSAIGLTPVSAAIAGAIAGVNVTVLFAGSGALLAAVALAAALSSTMRHIDSAQER